MILVEDSPTHNLNRSISDWIKAMSDPDAENNGEKALYSLAKDYLKTNPITFDEPNFQIKDSKYFSYNTILKSVTFNVNKPPPQV